MATVWSEGPTGIATAHNGDVSLAYRVMGDPGGEPMLLLCGNNVQMGQWPDELVSGLLGAGMQVAMFDNRDCGHSTHCADRPAYDLRDMARDAIAVLDAVGWHDAHLFGVSLGGMIGQVMAVHHPERVRTLTSVSSAPGWGLRISRPRLRTVIKIVNLVRRAGTGRDAAGDVAVGLFRLMGAPGQAIDEARVREDALAAYDIDADPKAGGRQLAAGKAGGDRRAELAGVAAPTLVVHGREDPLQSIRAGRATAAAIPGARILELPGAGHVLPGDAWPPVLRAVEELVRAIGR